ncbi:hypothetical protein [Pedobacter sp. MR2016-24]|uniref:hypothetical protein n=1 Tax=Pedobacter sp. MR2016-24 TaxID=2994466 RepID=UPI002247CFB2|nr:hypothetical protein [Pedobacter sp. MR2016-24]MCX2485346.1 hypothetical protein [Pedobacter sp. MR2016-24]
MKTIHLLYLIFVLFTLQSCNNFKSKHPQAEIANEDGATGMTDKSILIFAAAIDRQLNSFKKEISLIYQSGDLSIYAERYSEHNDGMLYKTSSSNGLISNTVKSYYFKNDSLILVKERSKIMNEEGQILKDTRTFLRNNIIFKIENRTAASPEAIRTLPYLLVQRSGNKYPDENFVEDIKVINDAIKGTDKFEMVFQNITTYPDSRYIVLKSKKQSNYTASILVKTKDSFIDSLLNMPSVFKDEKLNIRWKITDKDAVYVPVADTITSASGLNK